jgi:methionyl-tRNA formyltransferase
LASLGPALGLDIALVVTHPDNPLETIWFDNVADTARFYNLPTLLVADGKDPAMQAHVLNRVSAIEPDFIFSFYYRFMLSGPLLACAKQGAFNMHGSLLPKYRGRVPVNWAIIYGEKQTGATLHRMTEKPDAGALLGQQPVPILPDDTAKEVFDKVTVAAECVLVNLLPGIVDGSAREFPNALAEGSYFSGRTAEDGRIDFAKSASSVYNLIRAVAPPYYPGAFFDIGERRIVIEEARLRPDLSVDAARQDIGPAVENGTFWLICGDGKAIEVLAASHQGQLTHSDQIAQWIQHA